MSKRIIRSEPLRMEQKMEVYIEITARMEDTVDRQVDTCGKRMAACRQEFRQKVGTTWFRWVVGFGIAGVMAAAGLSADNRVILHDIQKNQAHHQLMTEPKASPKATLPDTVDENFSFKKVQNKRIKDV